MQMARLESERKSERGERERVEERQTERQMSNRGLLSLEQEAGLKQTVHPSKLHISPLTGRVRLSVNSPSPFAGPWYPFTLGSTGSTPPSALPLPFPSVRARVGRGSKASPLSLHSTGRKETAALICRPSSTLQPRVCFPRSEHQKRLNLWASCEALNRKSQSGTLPAQRTYCERLKQKFPAVD